MRDDTILKLSGYFTILAGVPILCMLFYISLTELPLWSFLPLLPLFVMCVLILISIVKAN